MKNLTLALDMSAQTIAERINVTTRTVRAWDAGFRTPARRNLAKLATLIDAAHREVVAASRIDTRRDALLCAFNRMLSRLGVTPVALPAAKRENPLAEFFEMRRQMRALESAAAGGAPTEPKPATEAAPLGNREDWLTRAVAHLSPLIESVAAKPFPEKFAVSCSWPNRTPRKTIGQCFASSQSHGVVHMMVSPVLGNPIDVLGTLVHEMVHAVDDCKSGHKGAFRRIATAVGLTGKMTETTVGADLREKLEKIAADLGTYPHTPLPVPGRKVGNRTPKLLCDSCGYTARTSQKWLDMGAPTCPCGTEMEIV